jgi:hypothetical protein
VTMEQPGVSRIVSVHLKHAGETDNVPALIAPDEEDQVEETARVSTLAPSAVVKTGT